MYKAMEVNYNQELSEFRIEINGNVFIIPSRKITDFKKKLSSAENCFVEDIVSSCSGIALNKDGKTKISTAEIQKIQKQIDGCIMINLPTDFELMKKGIIQAPQKPFSSFGCQIITEELRKKWSDLSNITINQVDVISHREDYECPHDFIFENEDFTKAFILGLDQALDIAKKNQNKINFFLMREQRHTFLLTIIGKDLFMFDSVGQRYGKSKSALGFPDNTDTLKLEEIAYTNMYLQFLKDNPEWNLYFNLNNLQQDTTNCFTFASDFLDGFCELISKNKTLDEPLEFSGYLKSFFPITLFENKQIHHEGAIDVMDTLLKDGYRDDFVFERPMLPQPMIRTSQLNSLFTEKAERICAGSTKTIELEKKIIRKKNASITDIFANRRIERVRKNQEQIILGAIK